MLSNLINKGLIDSVLDSDNNYSTNTDKARGIPNFNDAGKYTGYIDYSVKKDDYQILLSINDEGIYTAEYGEINISAGGNVAGGTTLVTESAFKNSGESTKPEDKGKFTLDKDASVMFVDDIGKDGEELSLYIKSGVHAKINVFKDMVLTNAGMSRSAIDIEPGGVLDLWIDSGAEVIVDSRSWKHNNAINILEL